MAMAKHDTPELRRARAYIGNRKNYGTPEQHHEARVEYKRLMLRHDIRAALETAPALPDAVRQELADLLRSGVSDETRS